MKLHGDLREFSVADLMRILEHGQRSGVLALETPRLQGALSWVGGRLTGATLGPLTGDEAIHPWLIWPEGQFVFHEDRAPTDGSIAMPLAEVLQESLRRQEAWSPISELAPGWGSDSAISWQGDADETVPLPTGGANALELIFAAGGATIPLGHRLADLIRNGRVHIEPTPAGALHRWFQRLTAELYHSFCAISGFKLIAELDRHLQAAIEAAGWNLAWSGGKITDKTPFARTADEQLALYEAFLREMAGFIVPVYGPALVRQATERAGEPTEPLAQGLKDRWLSAAPVSSKADEP